MNTIEKKNFFPEVSVSAGYPANGLYKLYIRQCKCELELGR